MPLGKDSMFTKTEAPVVVNPETDSKRASTKVSKVPAKKKGRAPKRPAETHPKATMPMPSRCVSTLWFFPLKKKYKMNPLKIVTRRALSNAQLLLSLYKREINKGAIMARPRKIMMIPKR